MLRQEAAEVGVLSEANVQSGMRAGLPAMKSNDKILWSKSARCAQRRNVKILEGNEDIGTRKCKVVRNRCSPHASREECCMLSSLRTERHRSKLYEESKAFEVVGTENDRRQDFPGSLRALTQAERQQVWISQRFNKSGDK